MEASKKKFEIEPLDVDKLVKVNSLAEISNPVFFNKFGQPTPDGLLSNEIFGITKSDRSTIYGFVNLGEPFINPSFYKAWIRLDSKIKECVHQTNTFKIGPEGKLEYDEKGSNGVKWLKDNFSKFKFKENDAFAHNQDIAYLKKFSSLVFITKYPIIPAYYRDVQTDGRHIAIEGINKLYNQLIIAVRSLSESSDYGLSLSGAIRGRIQECILEIYNWFGEEPQIGRKFGILRRANMAKTTDYSSRLVMTAPKLNVEDINDIASDVEHAAIPMASLCVNFFPFVLFHLRRFFENEFSGRLTYFVEDMNKEFELENYQIVFSDDELKKQIDRFVHGYANRFIPIEVPVKKCPKKIYMVYKGRGVGKEEFKKMYNKEEPIDPTKSTIIDRALTWGDVIYQAVVKAVDDKCVLITRYPMDSYFNQIPLMVKVQSTIETEPVILDGVLYKTYPKIRREDIGKDTSNKFIDTMNLCNVYLKSICGDYDGDTVSVKGVYTEEANAELKKQINSNMHWIGLNGDLAIFAHAQAIDAVYALTIQVPSMKKVTDPVF
jgi:hypothetical protein